MHLLLIALVATLANCQSTENDTLERILEGDELNGVTIDGPDLSHFTLNGSQLETVKLVDEPKGFSRWVGEEIQGEDLEDVELEERPDWDTDDDDEDDLLDSESDTAELYVCPDLKIKVPREFDWREHKVIGSIDVERNNCSLSWIYASASVIESIAAIKSGSLIRISRQQLIDCVPDRNDSACEGGGVGSVFDYVKEHGVFQDTEYPYFEKGSDNCYVGSFGPRIFLHDYHYADSCSNEQLMQIVYTYGPVLVYYGDDANQTFQQYKGGILEPEKDSGLSPAQVLALVGWGSKDGHDYWILKNSWGPFWGENGYVRLRRTQHSQVNEQLIYVVADRSRGPNLTIVVHSGSSTTTVQTSGNLWPIVLIAAGTTFLISLFNSGQ